MLAKTRARINKKISNKTLFVMLVILVAAFVASLKWTQRSACTFKVDSTCVTLERVSDTESLQLGLSNRDKLAPARGMLFDFPEAGEQCMWMKAMRFNLDMIWLDEGGKVTKIVEDVSPDTFPRAFCGQGKYVIEVNGGIASQAGVREGDILKL